MKPYFKSLLVAGALCCALGAGATSPAQQRIDSLRASHKMITFGEGNAGADSLRSLIDNFYIDQFRNSLEPDAPYFLFMSKKADMAMGIGGRLAVRGWYDWGAVIGQGGFAPADIPIPSDPAASHSLNGNVSGSRLYFKVLGQHSKIGNWQVYLEAKFSGGPSGRAFKLSKAYTIVRDWTVGYAPSTFEDPAAQPYTIDMQGPNSETSDTDVLVRWMHTFRKHWVVAASAEMPNQSVDPTAATVASASASMPNIAAFVQYQWGEDEHLRLSGIMRFLRYRDMADKENRTVAGWGIKASTVFRPWSGPLTVFASALYGRGIQSITNDLSGAGLDLLDNPADVGHMKAPALFGCYAGLQYNFSPSVFVSASVSELRLLPDVAVGADTYRYGLYGAANLMWAVTPRVLVGAEMDMGTLKQFSGADAWVHRVGLIAQMSF